MELLTEARVTWYGVPLGGPDGWSLHQLWGDDVDPAAWSGRERMVSTDAGARIELGATGEVHVDAAARTITWHVREELPVEAIVHPGLVAVAGLLAYWARRACLHGSAVVVGDRAWGLLADREGGKSTTAALLCERGAQVLSDDLLVIEGTTCFAGPPNVDLRGESAAILGGTALGQIGTRERWRRDFAAPEHDRYELGGFVRLGWAASTEVFPMDVGGRLPTLDQHTELPMPPAQLLDLAGLPMLAFDRPHDRGRMGASADRLLDALRAAGPT